MSPKDQERLFPTEYSAELLRIAEADHASGAYLKTGLAEPGVRPENVAYLFQQAIEKALKAAICAAGVAVPLVHDLGVLIGKLSTTLEADFGYELSDSHFGVAEGCSKMKSPQMGERNLLVRDMR